MLIKLWMEWRFRLNRVPGTLHRVPQPAPVKTSAETTADFYKHWWGQSWDLFVPCSLFGGADGSLPLLSVLGALSATDHADHGFEKVSSVPDCFSSHENSPLTFNYTSAIITVYLKIYNDKYTRVCSPALFAVKNWLQIKTCMYIL